MLALYLIGVVLACLAIWKVSDIFEDATEYLGRNMSNGVKGASLNAIGSSMPELITSFIFLFFLTGSNGYEGTIGTTAGSAVFNTLLIPACVILVVFIYKKVNPTKGISLNPKVVRRDGLFLILSELALIIFISTNTITLLDSILLMAIYLIYSIVLFKQSNDSELVREEGSQKETTNAWLKMALSVFLMTVICWGLVFSVEKIGEILNIPLIFVSIVLASAASSVPDTIISVRDGLKGNYDDAISNALGSNIFDICIAHGLPLFIYIAIYGPIVMTDEATQNSTEMRIALIVVTIIATIIYMVKKNFFKSQSYQLITLYILFIGYVCARAVGVEFF